MSTALIVNAYSYRNAGDAAIMLATAELLKSRGARHVSISSRYSEDVPDYARWDIELVPPVVRFPQRGNGKAVWRLARLSSSILSVALAILLAWLGFRSAALRTCHSARIVAQYDLVAIAGGGYLYSSRRLWNASFVHSCVTIWVCRIFARRCEVMPASIGPLRGGFSNWLVRSSLGKLRVVLRERASFAWVSLNTRQSLVVIDCPDIALWGLTGLKRSRRSASSPRVARVVAMDWTWSSSVDARGFDRYVSELAAVCDGLAQQGYQVELGGHSAIPEHNQDDIKVCESVRNLSVSRPLLDRNCDVEYLWKRYSEVDVVVGTRLHACIMATAVGTPSIALAYQEKTFGVATDLSAEAFAVDSFVADDVLAAVARCDTQRTAVAASEARARIGAVYAEE